jgi:hypothetical protein
VKGRLDVSRDRRKDEMRFALTILTVLALVGCSQDNAQHLPTAAGSTTPPATTRNSLTVYAMVVDESGACIVGATVRVVHGQALGQEIAQSRTCSVWDPDGVSFSELAPGVEMTLRASATGYTAQEKSVVPSVFGYPPLVFELSRIR